MDPVIGGLLTRWVVGLISGWLMSKGYADADTATAIAGGAAGLGTVAWSYAQKRKAGLL